MMPTISYRLIDCKGHGPLSSTYGMAADNVLEIRVVTPDGVPRTANPCVNPDLFWALRGGGGGTFGVLTSVTMKAYPSPQTSVHTFYLTIPTNGNLTLFWDLVAYTMSELPRFKDGGMQGYSTIASPGTVPGFDNWVWTWSFNLYDKPNGTAEALFAPLAAKLDPLNGTSIIYSSDAYWYSDFFKMWNSTIDFEAVADGGPALGSRLLPAESLADQKRISSVLQGLVAPKPGQAAALQMQAHLVASKHTGRDTNVSMTPAWSNAVVHFIVAEGFRDNDTFAQAQPTLNSMTYEQVALLKGLAPNSGAYQNEVCEDMT